MGELIVTEFVTLDGVAQAPGGPDEDRDGGFVYGGWQAPLLDQESGGAVFGQQVEVSSVTVMVLCPIRSKIDAALDEALDGMYRTSEPRPGRVLRRTS